MLSVLKYAVPKRTVSTAAFPYPRVHVPVMLQQVVTHLKPKSGGIYCDMTFGEGGYTKALLGKLHHKKESDCMTKHNTLKILAKTVKWLL